MPNQDAQRSIQNAISVCQELSKDQSVKTIKKKAKEKRKVESALSSKLFIAKYYVAKKNMGFFIHSGIVTDL